MNGQMQELLEVLKEWSDERHKENLAKFDLIFKRLNSLPCDERKGLYTSIKSQIAVMWTLIVLIITALVGMTMR